MVTKILSEPHLAIELIIVDDGSTDETGNVLRQIHDDRLILIVIEQKTLSAEPRRSFSNEFKLQMVKLALQPRDSVACIAREHDINDNLLFKWLRLWLIKGRISRRLPVTNSSGIGVELLPVEMTLDERPYPVFTRGNYEDQ